MSEWIVNSLGELVSFQKGRKVPTSQFLLNGYEPYLGAGALSGEHDGYAVSSFAIKANEKDILMLWDGERSGLCCSGLNGVVSSTVCKLTPKDNINSKLLYYFLANKFEWIQNRRTGTGVPHVPKDIGRILKVKYPKSLEVQNNIAEILCLVDATIEKTEKLIEKYQRIKIGMMQDLFTRGIGNDGKLRPTYTKSPDLYKKTLVGLIPNDWEVVRLTTVLDSVIDGPFGSNLKTEHYVVEPGVRVVRLQNIEEYLYDDSDKSYISDKHASLLIRNKVLGDDVLIAGLGDERYPVGRSCTYPAHLPVAVNKADCFRARCNSEMKNKFLMLYLNNEKARVQIRSYEQGVTRPRINTGNLKKLLIVKPSLDEQEAIVSKFENMQSALKKENSYLAKMKEYKKGLLKDLLTGKVTVQNQRTQR